MNAEQIIKAYVGCGPDCTKDVNTGQSLNPCEFNCIRLITYDQTLDLLLPMKANGKG